MTKSCCSFERVERDQKQTRTRTLCSTCLHNHSLTYVARPRRQLSILCRKFICLCFEILLIKNKSEQQLLMQFEAAKSQPYALSYQIHTSTSLMFYTSFTKLALFLKSMYLASSIVQMIE